MFLFQSDKNSVAIATYSSHRPIMGKAEIDNFFLSHWGYFDFFLTEMFIE